MTWNPVEYHNTRIARKIGEHLEDVATEQNAIAWDEAAEQFTFCIDLLEISAHDLAADVWVGRLEDRFIEILN